MADATKFQFTNPAVPKAYDEYFVPRLFEPWARLVLEEARLRRGEAMIDVATGPGTVARLAAPLLGPEGRVVATDIAKPMLDIARAKPVQKDAAAIEYVESGAAPLAAPSASFDVLVCQQGLQFFPDRPAAVREMHRVLKSGGRAFIAIWAEIERNRLFAAFHRALRATVPPELAELITAPFSWHRVAELKATAESSGFRDVRILTRSLPMVLEEGLDQAVASFGATPVSPGVAALPPASRDAFFARLREELAPLVRGGQVVGEMVSNIIAARRVDSSNGARAVASGVEIRSL
jgi:ubiquinone/menaquinone biosynthesis C-methylase UbiE